MLLADIIYSFPFYFVQVVGSVHLIDTVYFVVCGVLMPVAAPILCWLACSGAVEALTGFRDEP